MNNTSCWLSHHQGHKWTRILTEVISERKSFICIVLWLIYTSCFGFMCTKNIHGWVSSDTLNQYTWFTLDYEYSVDTPSTPQLTLNQHFGQQSVRSWLLLDPCIWVGQHLADYRLAVDQVLRSVNQVLIRISIKYCLISRSRVLIKGIDWHSTVVAGGMILERQESWFTSF